MHLIYILGQEWRGGGEEGKLWGGGKKRNEGGWGVGAWVERKGRKILVWRKEQKRRQGGGGEKI